LNSESPDGGRQGLCVIPAGSDDVLWIQVLTFCVDAPTFVVGGVSADVASLVLTSQHSEQVVLETYDVSGAVIGELPRNLALGQLDSRRSDLEARWRHARRRDLQPVEAVTLELMGSLIDLGHGGRSGAASPR
jgi:hypothetical protein